MRYGLQTWCGLALAGLTFGATGCCGLGDPSCAVQKELYGGQFGRELLYCPQTSLEGLNSSAWYCEPRCWGPECSPALVCGPDEPAPTATARDVYALPSYRSPLDRIMDQR